MLQKLEEKLEEINRIPSINRGGCAILAVSIALFIKRQNIFASPKVYYTSCGSNKEAIRKNNLYLLDCNHAFVKWNNLFIDSNGIKSKEEINLSWESAEEIPLKLVKNHISDANHWNSSFDRNNTKEIDNILGSKLHKELEIP